MPIARGAQLHYSRIRDFDTHPAQTDGSRREGRKAEESVVRRAAPADRRIMINSLNYIIDSIDIEAYKPHQRWLRMTRAHI